MTKRGLRWTLLLWFGVMTIVSLSACTGLAGDTEIVATIPIGNASADNPVALQSTEEIPNAAQVAQGTGPTPTSLASFGISVDDLQTPEAPGDLGYPAAAPNLVNGSAIFAQRCTACHGTLGEGDGPLVLNGEVPAPPSFQDEEYVRTINPKDWFRTITNGRIENLMPPWKDALTEQERWDVAMYTYTLHYTADQLELGSILYSDCAECHGDTGNGDGPEANKHPENPAAALTSLKSLNDLSDANMFVMVNEGQSDLMPAYGDQFSDEEIRAVVAYARTLGLTNLQPITDDDPLVRVPGQPPTATLESQVGRVATDMVPDGSNTTGGIVPPHLQPTLDSNGSGRSQTVDQTATPTPESRIGQVATEMVPDDTTTTGGIVPPQMQPTLEASSDALTISGTVTNQTEGGSVPDGMTVSLQVYTAADLSPLPELTQTTTLNADGSYQFADVPYDPEHVYLTAVSYLNRDFASGIYQPDPASPALEMPILIYELTDDPSVLTVNASVTQIQIGGNTLEATYSVRFVNTSDRLFTSLEPEADGRRYRSMQVTLPPGALVVGIVDQPRYIYDEEANAVYDTSPLQPGEERFIQVTYLLDYTSGAVIEYTMPYKLDGQLRVLLENPTITLEGNLLPSQGEEELGGVTYQGYGERVTLEAGTTIRYTLTGEGGDAAILPTDAARASSASGTGASGVVTSDTLLPMLAILGVGVVIAGGVFTLVRRTPSTSSPVGKQHLIDGLIRQIAELDAQHDAGQINHDVYRHRREQLKARLTELMDEATTAS